MPVFRIPAGGSLHLDKKPTSEMMSGYPMIEVKDLTKRYAGNTAIEGLSFAVGQGEVVGFLGPNGAGKSTTMRILSCFMPATSGSARVAGFDVFSDADEVRRRIGYMPENNPLHGEMRVREYLKFRARLKGLNRAEARARIDLVIQQCSLTDVDRKIIGQLSKGYRQRVGLADALVHEPQLIILDEPTIGLDPHQIRSFRQLVKSLGEQHTVLISTHILPEVEMTCNRVLILHQGRILASDTPENLQKIMSHGIQVIAELKVDPESLRVTLATLDEIEHYEAVAVDSGYLRCTFWPSGGVDIRPLIDLLAREKNWPLRELRRSRHSLEDIFVHMTREKRTEEEEEDF